MDIIYLGHSSFKLNFRSATVLTDPFDSSVGISFSKQTADIVTVSHDHGDHNNIAGVEGYRKVISGPGEYEIDGISIIGIKTFHDENTGSERGGNTVYIFEAEDLRIAHLGDLGHKLSEVQSDKIGDIDVLMVPVGGIYTIDPKAAVEVVQSIEPEIVIPMHYKTNELNQDTFGKLSNVEEFTKELGAKVMIEKKLSIKSTDLSGEDQRVVILSRK